MKQCETAFVCVSSIFFFEKLEKEVRFTKACEPAGFMRSLYWNALQRHSRCE